MLLAHTLREVGILGTILLRVSFGTILQFFAEIGSYSTHMEQKVSWHSFSETQCITSIPIFNHSILHNSCKRFNKQDNDGCNCALSKMLAASLRPPADISPTLVSAETRHLQPPASHPYCDKVQLLQRSRSRVHCAVSQLCCKYVLLAVDK